MLAVAPILPSRDLSATSGFYSRLGLEWRPLDLPGEGIPRLQGPPSDSDYGLRESSRDNPPPCCSPST